MKRIVMSTAYGLLMAGVFSSCGNGDNAAAGNDLGSVSNDTTTAKTGIQQAEWGEF